MFPTLGQLASEARCAIYNDLSHMNPMYLTPQRYAQTFHEEELLYHKRNLILLSLYFDKIVICVDNLLAFTKFLSKDVVSSVVTSPWFTDLVEQKVIVLAGWGTSISLDFMKNQQDYSSLYRPDLKEARYTDFLNELSDRASWVVREESAGEKEHINYLRPHLKRLEGTFETKDVQFLVDLAEQTNDSVGYIGTMEIFPFIDELYGSDAERSDAFYRSYYISWHEYCAAHYAPAIPIHTRRIALPRTTIALAPGASALGSLYSPDVFEKYLVKRFGTHLVSRLLEVSIAELMAIRNGDWARFRGRYHDCLQAASRICWIAYHPQAHAMLSRDEIIDELLAEIFRATARDPDLSALGNAIDLVMGLALGATGAASIFALFKKQIDKRLGRLTRGGLRSDLEPYLRKLQKVLEGRPGLVLTPSTR